MPQFTNEEFYQKHQRWKKKYEEKFLTANGKAKTKAQLSADSDEDLLAFRRKYYWPQAPIAYGLAGVLTVVVPTVMHALGHLGMLIMEIYSKVFDRSTKGYKLFMKNLRTMHNYLNDGNICASTSTLFQMIHEFSCKLDNFFLD